MTGVQDNGGRLRCEVLALPEGDVVIQFPDILSIESVLEIEQRLALFIRIRKRIASAPTAEPER